ncbi:DUF4012 domain-containing protein [Microbacterium deminutum]|uniref:DUF4012 domain-containing protein n=1 Tax=Microbacterium deminutum TaxID=344164 RepID=A0ABP5CJG2_9MICO
MLWLSLGVLGLLVVCAVAWIGIRALMLRTELDAAVRNATELRGQLEASDLGGAQRSAGGLAEHARVAAELTGDPIWHIAEVIPAVGPNLTAARVVSSELDHLSRAAITPTLAMATDLASLRFKGGLDLDALTRAATRLHRSLAVVADAHRAVGSLDAGALVGPLRDGVDRLEESLTRVEPLIRDAALAAGTLPTVLGSDGPRSILVMVQNGAELRTAGGLTGTFAEIRADHGRLQIVDQASSSDFPWLEKPIIALPASVSSMLNDAVGRYVMNISSPSDFTESAQLASAWWSMRTGHTPDTIVSVDIRVLGAVLAVIGPVDVKDWGELTTDNLVQRILVDPYRSLDSWSQDVVFRRAVDAVFARALQTTFDPSALVARLSGPISEGRVSIWSADPEVESVVADGAFAGTLARQKQVGDDAFAVYLNDVTGAKMDTYLDVNIASGVAECRADGLRDITIGVTLTNTAPGDAGSIYPVSVTGGGLWGVAPGNIGTLVGVSAPPGTFIGGVTRAGEHVRSISTDVDDYPLTQTRVELAPGQSATVEFHFVAAHAGDVTPRILHTPLIDDPEVTQSSPARCR